MLVTAITHREITTMSNKKVPQLAPTIFITALMASSAQPTLADEMPVTQTIAAVQLSKEPAPPILWEDRMIGG